MMRIDIKKAIAALDAAEKLSHDLDDLIDIRERLKQVEADVADLRKALLGRNKPKH